MNNVVERPETAGGEPKQWSVPTLEKVEMNETAGSFIDTGGQETTFPALRPS